MATDLVTIATTAVLTQFLGPSAKHLGEQALERGKQMAARATNMLAQIGHAPQPVELKLLIPIVQAASLEMDKNIAEKWAALLANAANPTQSSIIHPRYVETLRQLTSAEAILLSDLFAKSEEAHNAKQGLDKMLVKSQYRKQDAMSYRLDLNAAFRSRYPKRKPGKSALDLGDEQYFDTMIDNILSFGIINILPESHEEKNVAADFSLNRSWALFTSFGYDFMKVVNPPTP